MKKFLNIKVSAPQYIKDVIKNLLVKAGLDIDTDIYYSQVIVNGFLIFIFVTIFAYVVSIYTNYELELFAYPLIGLVFFIAYVVFKVNTLLLVGSKKSSSFDDYIPDFLNLMASHVRSGVTYDRALLLSSRKEFGQLAKEIDLAAKEIIAGKPLEQALLNMAKRIRSEKFSKSIRLVVEGVNSGGNLADLLEATAYDMRRFDSLRKDINSQLLSYAIFIFAAAAIGAPALYAVSTFLISIIIKISGEIQVSDSISSYLPLISNIKQEINKEVLQNFSLASIFVTCLFALLSAGTVFANDETKVIVYFPFMLILAYAIFFGISYLLGIVFQGLSK
ncbi:MAG: type II secretion system F family protein [Candidatus Micrarchaeota archaeon]|nr:type II secretion system F family protein [Candidatus Micrarchaeota archaeon]